MTTKQKGNSAAKNELTRIESSLKKKQIASKSWRDDFISIATIEAVLFNTLSQQKDVQIFAVFIRDIDIELNKKKKSIIDSKTIVFIEYHDFLNVFSKKKADELLSHRKYNHRIEIVEEKDASNRASLYHMSKKNFC